MSWEQGEPTQRRSRRATVVVAGIVLAVLLLGFLTRQATPSDTLEVETEPPDRPEPVQPPEPAPTVSEQTVEVGFPPGSGLTLWAMDRRGELARVDLDSGAVARTRVVDRPLEAVKLMAAGEGIAMVFSFSGETPIGQARYLADLEGPTVDLGRAQGLLPSVTPGRLWLLDGSPVFDAERSTRLREVSYDGTTTVETTLPPGIHPYAAVEGGLLVNPTGSVVVYDPVSQEGRSIGDGVVLAADTQRVLRRVCDEGLRCRVAMGPLELPDAASVTVPAEAEASLVSGFTPPTLSPTGRWVSFVDSMGQDLAVLDVTTGELRPAPDALTLDDAVFWPFSSSYAWAPSGEWLFSLDRRGGVSAWNLLEDTVVPLEFDLSDVAGIAVS